ncbi:aspartate/glutamate racemase family protein [Ascidiimonas sp. W6]|uniref:aspartate/glutamate racemase family protein n=1 Tax=Ascidiimonas meishanensis TaxID=3128903 RepID=UPI0030EEDBC7
MIENEKIIGIVGGMGPRAGLALHESIVKHSEAKTDQDHISIAHLSYSKVIEDRTKFLEGFTLENPANKIVEIIQLLYRSGAGIIGIPCNTTHVPRIFDVITKELKNKGIEVSLKHMVHETVKHTKYMYPNAKKIAVMSTNGTYKSNVYTTPLENQRFEVFIPEKHFQDKVIHRMIYDPVFGLKANFEVTPPVYELLNQALQYFLENKVEVIILGCTEFSLIPRERMTLIPIVDSLDVLAQSLVTGVRSEINALAI